MAMRATLSVAMIARNEEANLPRTLAAVRWVDEIVIVDSGSVDRTPEIARSFGAKHSFNRDFHGHAAQKNVALDKCTCEWILLLDADEVFLANSVIGIWPVQEISGCQWNHHPVAQTIQDWLAHESN